MESFNDYIVDTKKLISNIKNIKNYLDDNVKLCAIVKADAYGLGIEAICRSIKPYCDYFGVACIKEAKEIRLFDTVSKILILSPIPKQEYLWCSKNNVSVTISSENDIDDIIETVSDSINIHIAINSGMNRIGFNKIKDFKNVIKKLNDTNIILEGLFSHFATKSNDVVFIKRQFYNFSLYTKQLKSKVLCHISNSFALTYNKMYHLDMVRSGFLMYGNISSNNILNKPVLTIISRVVHILRVNKGESIGYDRNYIATKNTTVAIVPIGYADGLDRRLSNKGYFYINNRKCSIIGNICMDSTMVDITDVDVNINDKVLILGALGGFKISLDDYSKLLGTSPYEIQLKFRYKRMNYIVK